MTKKEVMELHRPRASGIEDMKIEMKDHSWVPEKRKFKHNIKKTLFYTIRRIYYMVGKKIDSRHNGSTNNVVIMMMI